MSKNFWHVSTMSIGSVELYQAYRLIDPEKPDQSGNRMFDSKVFEKRRLAEARCRELNAPLAGKVQASAYMYGERIVLGE